MRIVTSRFFAPEFEPLGHIQEHFDDVVAGVAAEGFPDEAVAGLQLGVQFQQLLPGVLELLGHTVEGGGEIAHEIDFLLQIPGRHLLRLPGQVPQIGVQGLQGLDHRHPAGHRPGVQLALRHLGQGLAKSGEFHQKAIDIGDQLTDFIVRQILRNIYRRSALPMRR